MLLESKKILENIKLEFVCYIDPCNPVSVQLLAASFVVSIWRTFLVETCHCNVVTTARYGRNLGQCWDTTSHRGGKLNISRLKKNKHEFNTWRKKQQQEGQSAASRDGARHTRDDTFKVRCGLDEQKSANMQFEKDVNI